MYVTDELRLTTNTNTIKNMSLVAVIVKAYFFLRFFSNKFKQNTHTMI